MILESSLERTASSPPDTATGLSRPAELERLHKLRTDVVNERRGAFSNLIQDPTMVALLIPTGVTGILALFLRQLVGGD